MSRNLSHLSSRHGLVDGVGRDGVEADALHRHCRRQELDGEILTEGSPEDIVNNPDVRRLYLGEEFRL